MLGFIKKFIIKTVTDHRNSDTVSVNKYSRVEVAVPSPSHAHIHSNSMTLNMWQANGGWVIEFEKYDPHTDRHNRELHIISEDDDLGEKISQIVPMYLLRNG